MSKLFFIVVEKESFFVDFFNEERLDGTLRENFDTIDEFIDSSNCYENIVLLWHLSSSGIEVDELENKIEAIDKKYKQKIIVKIGKSEDTTFLNKAENTKWFDICDYGENIKEGFNKCGWNINLIINGRVKKEKLKNYLLMHFLPLDLYLQALKNTEEATGYLQGMSSDLEVLYKSNKNEDAEESHYRRKLYDFWYLIGQEKLLTEIGEAVSSKVKNLPPIDNPSKELLKIAGINNKDPKASRVYKFFESLDTIKVDDKNLAKAVDYLCKPFDIQITGEKKKITTFHDWYCALAKCLRNETKS